VRYREADQESRASIVRAGRAIREMQRAWPVNAAEHVGRVLEAERAVGGVALQNAVTYLCEKIAESRSEPRDSGASCCVVGTHGETGRRINFWQGCHYTRDMGHGDRTVWLIAGASLYASMSAIWLFRWFPETTFSVLVTNPRATCLLGPPLALLGASNWMLLTIYVVGTLLCGWLFWRVVRTQAVGATIVAAATLLFVWLLFGLVASAPLT
jgi:hypothetical protein